MTQLYKFATLSLLLVFATYYFNQGWYIAGGAMLFGALMFMAVVNTPKGGDNDE